jgi:hypothetical protein
LDARKRSPLRVRLLGGWRFSIFAMSLRGEAKH